MSSDIIWVLGTPTVVARGATSPSDPSTLNPFVLGGAFAQYPPLALADSVGQGVSACPDGHPSTLIGDQCIVGTIYMGAE